MSDTATKPSATSKRRFGYRDILDHLLGEIHGGRWQVGEPIVSEADLVNQFGTTRTTVRQALKEIEILGYIKRKRGTRSVLISTDPSEDFVNSVRSIEEMLQYSRRTRSKLLSVTRVTANAALAAKLGEPLGTNWIRAEYLRNPLRGSLPIGYSEVYLAETYGDIEPKLSDDRTVYSLLQDQYGGIIHKLDQEVQAAAVDRQLAETLKVDKGSPMMVVRTKFITGAGATAEVGFGHFPAGRFRLEMVLERSPGEQLE